MPMNDIIELKNATIYQRDKVILSDVTFSIGKGEFVYLIGRTGSGKSSLLRTLYAELPTYDGQVYVAGYDLTEIRRKEIPYLRRKLGIVFQDFQLLDDRNVEGNLEFVLRATGWYDKEEISHRIDRALEKVGLQNKRKSMPYNLSGGEQQGVTIARALLNNPDVILADEPTGNLDPETATNIVALLKEISLTGTAVVMSTHNIPMLDKFPGIVYQCEESHIKEITQEYNHTKS